MSALRMYKELIRLALPILVGQVGMIVVGFADNIMVGRYSTDALASASFVNNVFNVIVLGVIGFSYGITPLAGALFSSNAKSDIGSLVRSAVRLNLWVTLLMALIMTILYFNLHRLGQPEHLLPTIRPYYLIALAGLLPIMFFNVFSQWSYAINNTRMPMWIILTANAVNVIGNYIFIYGHFGMPELGLTGAGLSTLAARILCAVAIAMVFFRSKKYADYARGFFISKVWRTHTGKIFRTSYPIAIQMICESGSFTVAGIMAGWMGHIELAALQVIIIVGTLGFCIYYSFGSAVAVKVANAAGSPTPADMRRYAWRGYHVMLVLMLAASLTFIFFGKQLMGVFSEDERVVSMAIGLIPPLVLYQLGDATQINFANSLRGTSHVKPMSWIAFFCYIVAGIPATYLMTFTFDMRMTGLVGSFSVSLFLAGALFLIYFLRATRHAAPSPK
ncbi:MAG: MATE family efflux transporter [Muribaculaceae bacterium]|nr:MATE family efflux transporter [Muribaculaceae bacterium]